MEVRQIKNSDGRRALSGATKHEKTTILNGLCNDSRNQFRPGLINFNLTEPHQLNKSTGLEPLQLLTALCLPLSYEMVHSYDLAILALVLKSGQ